MSGLVPLQSSTFVFNNLPNAVSVDASTVTAADSGITNAVALPILSNSSSSSSSAPSQQYLIVPIAIWKQWKEESDFVNKFNQDKEERKLNELAIPVTLVKKLPPMPPLSLLPDLTHPPPPAPALTTTIPIPVFSLPTTTIQTSASSSALTTTVPIGAVSAPFSAPHNVVQNPTLPIPLPRTTVVRRPVPNTFWSLCWAGLSGNPDIHPGLRIRIRCLAISCCAAMTIGCSSFVLAILKSRKEI